MATKEKGPDHVPLREQPVTVIADTLQRVLGQRLTAYAISERNPKQIGALARAEAELSDKEEATLRDLAEVTEVLIDGEGGPSKGTHEIVRSVMVGMNPLLGDQAPLELFRDGESHRVVAVAQELLPR